MRAGTAQGNAGCVLKCHCRCARVCNKQTPIKQPSAARHRQTQKNKTLSCGTQAERKP
jgi:hypothetical protein